MSKTNNKNEFEKLLFEIVEDFKNNSLGLLITNIQLKYTPKY